MKIPEKTDFIKDAVNTYHYEKNENPRPHLGCSLIGHHCERFLWLSFRWAVLPNFDGRMKRLFRRGFNEEDTVILDLKNIGCIVDRSQNKVELSNHIGGSVDGIIKSGVIGAEKTEHILEIKTHSLKSFEDLIKNKVEKSKPQHYAQMQLYMMGMKINRALYYSVCKNDDRIYTERIKLDEVFAIKLLKKAERIVNSEEIPPLTYSKTWYQCKFCDAYKFCHETNKTKQVNCRTCCHSTPSKNNTWICEKFDNAEIPIENSFNGCESHIIRPDLVPWPLIDAKSTENLACYEIAGKEFFNGEGHYESSYLLAEYETQKILDVFDGEFDF